LVAIEHGVDGADRRQLHWRDLMPQFLPDLGRAPAGIFALEPDDRRLDRGRQPIRLPIRSAAAIIEGHDTAVFIPVEDLVAGLAGDAKLGA